MSPSASRFLGPPSRPSRHASRQGSATKYVLFGSHRGEINIPVKPPMGQAQHSVSHFIPSDYEEGACKWAAAIKQNIHQAKAVSPCHPFGRRNKTFIALVTVVTSRTISRNRSLCVAGEAGEAIPPRKYTGVLATREGTMKGVRLHRPPYKLRLRSKSPTALRSLPPKPHCFCQHRVTMDSDILPLGHTMPGVVKLAVILQGIDRRL